MAEARSVVSHRRVRSPLDPPEMVTARSDYAYAALLEAIATCKIPPGALLNERDEAAKLGMSRTPLRQALHRLALEGLVHVIPKQGAMVTLLDPDEIRDNLIIRGALEVEMLRRGMAAGRGPDAKALRGHLLEMAAALADGRRTDFLAADEGFHHLIVAAGQNAQAVEAVRRTWLRANRARYLQDSDPAALRGALREHRAIAAAIRAGDVAAAERALRAHIDRSLVRVRDLTIRIPSAFRAGPEDPV